MNLKRDNWTNDEVIKLLEGCILPPLPDGGPYGGEESGDDNFSLKMAIYLFYDMKADPEKVAGAKALDTDTGRIFCVGPKLPQ